MQDLLSFLQNHGVLTLALVVILSLLLIVELIRLKHGAERVSPSQLTHLINHKNAVVVDLRPSEAFEKGHIAGALSLPLAEFKKSSKKLDSMKSRPIVIICAKGVESPKIATSLKQKGFNVQVLSGGLQTWTSADMPLVKD